MKEDKFLKGNKYKDAQTKKKDKINESQNGLKLEYCFRSTLLFSVINHPCTTRQNIWHKQKYIVGCRGVTQLGGHIQDINLK